MPNNDIEQTAGASLAAAADTDQGDEFCPMTPFETELLKVVREHSGYDGYDDQTEGVDVLAETRECLEELAACADRYRQEVLKRDRAERDERPMAKAATAALAAATLVAELAVVSEGTAVLPIEQLLDLRAKLAALGDLSKATAQSA